MVEENLLISHGEPQWDVKYNKLVNAVEKMGGLVKDLQWTEWTKEGLGALNGVQITDGGYNYLDVGGVKLVLLSISIKITGDVKTSSVVVSLPDVITPRSMYMGSLGGQNQFQISGNKITIFDAAGSTERQLNGNDFVLTKLYIA